jgi:uncharacterized protein with NAD-binding domain and iron-sulfur cluster
MGLAETQARTLMLTRYKSDLEFGMQMICQKRTVLCYQAQAAAEDYPELAAQYHLMDKALETELQTLETQHKIVSTELESTKKIVEDHATKDFKYV